MLDENFLANKLTGVKLEKMRIDIKYPWHVNVNQNTNSDLPEKWIERDKPNVQAFVKSIVENTPIDKRIFILTTNAILKAYLKDYFVDQFPNRQFVTGYFGNIRGINDAKDCDLGIMLGSFMPSDSVEIAMALEFVDPINLDKDITLTENNLWKWKNTNSVRTYNDEFAIIGEMAKAYRHSEHRQALARTRYLFHDVNFYIISKDSVSDYDPFLPIALDEQYRADLLPPRPPRPEKLIKYVEVSKAVFDWLELNDTVNATTLVQKRILTAG
ncbi:MAG: hypothetical protein GY702_19040 [Desulfobulbaceae bacterium]|nr:hypothetical protein [Desulfobulbaceae bacterium]